MPTFRHKMLAIGDQRPDRRRLRLRLRPPDRLRDRRGCVRADDPAVRDRDERARRPNPLARAGPRGAGHRHAPGPAGVVGFEGWQPDHPRVDPRGPGRARARGTDRAPAAARPGRGRRVRRLDRRGRWASLGVGRRPARLARDRAWSPRRSWPSRPLREAVGGGSSRRATRRADVPDGRHSAVELACRTTAAAGTPTMPGTSRAIRWSQCTDVTSRSTSAASRRSTASRSRSPRASSSVSSAPTAPARRTLVNLLSGRFRPTPGEIRDRRPRRSPACRRIAVAHLGVARTYQIPRPFESMTVRDNVAMAIMFGRVRRALAEARAAAEEHLDFVGLGHLADALPVRDQPPRAPAAGDGPRARDATRACCSSTRRSRASTRPRSTAPPRSSGASTRRA